MRRAETTRRALARSTRKRRRLHGVFVLRAMARRVTRMIWYADMAISRCQLQVLTPSASYTVETGGRSNKTFTAISRHHLAQSGGQ